MEPHAWRRTHGPDITAEVISDGCGAWRAKASLTSNPTVSVTSPRQADNLPSAQDKADMLVRKTFDHQCGVECGPWLYEPNRP